MLESMLLIVAMYWALPICSLTLSKNTADQAYERPCITETSEVMITKCNEYLHYRWAVLDCLIQLLVECCRWCFIGVDGLLQPCLHLLHSQMLHISDCKAPSNTS